MSEKKNPPAALPQQLSVLDILGLTESNEGDWARLRGVQFSRLAKVAPLQIGVHSIAAALMAALYAPLIPPLLLLSWLGLLGLVLIQAIRTNRALADADLRSVTRKEFHRKTASTAVVSLVWSVPIVFFPFFGGGAQQAAGWLVVVMLLASSALLLASAPLGTIISALIIGLAATTSFVLDGQYVLAISAAAFLLVICAGAIEVARTFLTAQLAEAGYAEKSEVVSMLLREFEESQADWLWQIDTTRKLRNISPRFAFALGVAPEEAAGRPLLELLAGEDWEMGRFSPSLHDLAERLKRRESFSNLLVQVNIGREKRWWELSGTPILDEEGTYLGFRGVGSDVTEQRESSEKIAYLARYDTLSGLPNRLMIHEALDEALRYARQWRSRCAFLMIDLDRFKAVNDSLGHMVGDQLLAQVSARLKSLMGEAEMCGRLGGDEFAVVIREVSSMEHISNVARAIIQRLSEPYEVDHHTLYVGACVGSALGPRDGENVEEIMRNADLALYRAKDAGGGEHFSYEPTLHVMAEERRQLEFSLRKALERKEFSLNYQPVVDANEETVVSFEALLRWNSEQHGFVPPDKFIPIAEDTRLIVPIGDWVLREACREAMSWPSAIRVAVNVSGEQLLDPRFANSVIEALAATGLPASRLEIEVTESIFLRDAVTARSTLENIIALGCSIALDDFGTGYSSLGYLRKLRFSTIKVDRSFVQGAAQNSPESLAIIRAVVAMADSLEMTTTAEGVETAEEAEMIRNLGCTKIQGYYFGRPMAADDARELFRGRGATRQRA